MGSRGEKGRGGVGARREASTTKHPKKQPKKHPKKYPQKALEKSVYKKFWEKTELYRF